MGSLCSNSPEVKETIKTKDPDFLIPMAYHYDFRKKFSFIKILNKGAYGQVKLYYDKTFSEAKYALKTISKETLTTQKFNHIKSEIEILSNLDHPNIVNYYCTFETPSNFNILMEYFGNNNSFYKSITENRNKIKIEDFRLIIYQILSALCYLHGRGIVHRDIKPENILLESDYEVRLIDFGLSCNLKNVNEDSFAGSPNFMAPEAVNCIASYKNDIWGIGVIYYIFCFGKLPFIGKNTNDLIKKINNDNIDFVNGRFNDVEDKDINLIKKMLEKNHKNRIDASTAIRNEVFDVVKKNFFNHDTIDKYIDEFFSENTLKLITKYVESSILKKTFVYLYVWFSPFEKRQYFKKMFMAIDNYFNYSGYLKSREVFEEFKGRNLIDEEGGKIFSFIDLNNSNKAKTLFKKEESNVEDSDDKKLTKNTSSKSLKYKNWGIISYAAFLSFFYIEDIKNIIKDEEKIKYLFNFFCDRPLCDNPKNEVVYINGEVKPAPKDFFDDPETITKYSFMRLCYKQNLPVKDSQDDINKFFIEHPNPIDYEEFKKLIFEEGL